ncbi:hypothetical protein Bca4012_027644 [Brassica carinata]
MHLTMSKRWRGTGTSLSIHFTRYLSGLSDPCHELLQFGSHVLSLLFCFSAFTAIASVSSLFFWLSLNTLYSSLSLVFQIPFSHAAARSLLQGSKDCYCISDVLPLMCHRTITNRCYKITIPCEETYSSYYR